MSHLYILESTLLCSNVPNLRSPGPVLQGSIFFFAAGTNRVPVRDSRAGAPLTEMQYFFLKRNGHVMLNAFSLTFNIMYVPVGLFAATEFIHTGK